MFKNNSQATNLFHTFSAVTQGIALHLKLLSFPANICLDEDVLKTSWRRLSSSSLEDVFKMSSRRIDQDEYVHPSLTSSEDVFKTSSRHLGQDQYIRLGHMSSRRFQDVFKTSSRCLQDVLPRRLQDVLKTSSRHLQDVFKEYYQVNLF